MNNILRSDSRSSLGGGGLYSSIASIDLINNSGSSNQKMYMNQETTSSPPQVN